MAEEKVIPVVNIDEKGNDDWIKHVRRDVPTPGGEAARAGAETVPPVAPAPPGAKPPPKAG